MAYNPRQMCVQSCLHAALHPTMQCTCLIFKIINTIEDEMPKATLGLRLKRFVYTAIFNAEAINKKYVPNLILCVCKLADANRQLLASANI